MRVFISWSGAISQQIAKSIYDWLPSVLQNVEPFMSSEDIEKGARWLSSMATELQNCHFGLICLTPENLNAPWIHFEAGSVSKLIDRSRLVPILFKLEPSDVQGPLTQFQMVNFGQDEIYRLLQSINNVGEERKLEEGRLEKAFKAFWPELEKSVSRIEFNPPEGPQGSSAESEEGVKPILEEILVVVRQQSISSSKPYEHVISQLEEQAVLLREIIRANKVGVRTLEAIQSLSEVWRRYAATTLSDYSRKLTETGLTHDDLKPLLEGAGRMNTAMDKLVEISGAKPNTNQTRARLNRKPNNLFED
jgi:hypothetical protein